MSHWTVQKCPAHSSQPPGHVGLLIGSNLSSPPLLQVLCQLTSLDSSLGPRSKEGQTLQEAQALSPHHLHAHRTPHLPHCLAQLPLPCLPPPCSSFLCHPRLCQLQEQLMEVVREITPWSSHQAPQPAIASQSLHQRPWCWVRLSSLSWSSSKESCIQLPEASFVRYHQLSGSSLSSPASCPPWVPGPARTNELEFCEARSWSCWSDAEEFKIRNEALSGSAMLQFSSFSSNIGEGRQTVQRLHSRSEPQQAKPQ